MMPTPNTNSGQSGVPGEDVSRVGLTLVIGPANSGKMGRALEWWRARLAFRPIMVAPTVTVAGELTVEMVRRAGALIGQSPAVTFDGLVREILEAPPHYISALQTRLILSQLLRGAALRTLRAAGEFPGVVTALATLLRQLGESDKSYEEVSRILAKWGRADPGVAALAEDLLQIVTGYAAACSAHGLTDRPTAVLEARARLKDWDRPVVFHGYTSFTGGQRALIRALSTRVPVLVTLPHERLRAVNLTDALELSRWEAIADRVVELAPQPRAYAAPAIAYLERGLLNCGSLQDPPPPASGPYGVRFLLASGQRNEAELVAQHVSELIRQGFSPGDIGIIVRHVRSWSTLLGQVFDSCDIPYSLDVAPTLGETGLGHALICALKSVVHDDADALLAYLRSPYSGLDLDEVYDAELEYRRKSARGFSALAAIIERSREGFLDPVRDTVTGALGARSLDVGGIEGLALNMLAAGVRGLEATGREVEVDVGAFNALLEAMASLRALVVDGLGFKTVDAGVLLPALADLGVSQSSTGKRNAVVILDPERARARRFEVVMILGLVEGEFPGKPDAPSVLTESQRAGLNSAAEGSLVQRDDENEEAMFVSAVSRAWQLLYLSARDADDGGEETSPSRYWLRAKELLGVGESEQDRRTLADVVFAAEAAPALRHYRRARAVGRRAGRLHGPEGRSREARPADDGSGAFLRDVSVLAELRAINRFSPSALEKYVSCPLAWFLERVVGMEDVGGELDHRAMGELLHTTLSTLYKELAASNSLPIRAGDEPRVAALASSIVECLVENQECPGSAADKRIAACRLKEMVRGLLRMEMTGGSGLVVTETEVEVGGAEGVDIGGISVKGRIDRIDADSEGRYLFIVDYKSGKVPSVAEMSRGDALQLPLYLMALEAERPDADVIGGAYVSAADLSCSGVLLAERSDSLGPVMRGCRELSSIEMEGLLRSARDAAIRAAEGIRSGIISPRPDRDCPAWCVLGGTCRARSGGYRL